MSPSLRLAGRLLAVALILVSTSAFAGTNGTIGLAWDPPLPADPHVDGWFLYWGDQSGGPYPNKSPPILNDGTSTPSYTMTGLTDCTMYYIVVTAFAYVAGDDAGTFLESAFSNEAYGWPRPTVTLITPASAAQQASLSMAIEGTNFNTTWGTPAVSFDDPAITAGAVAVQDCYHLSVPVDVNCSRTGSILVTVTNPEGTTGKSGTLFSVTPASGCVPPDAGAPGLDAAAPGPDAAAPGLDAAAPGLDAAAPGRDASGPGLDAAGPGLDAAAPGRDASGPGLDAAAPGLDASALPPDATSPGEDAATAQVDAAVQPGTDAAGPADASQPGAPDSSVALVDGSTPARDAADLGPILVEAGCGCSASSLGGPALFSVGLLLAFARRRRG